MTYGHRTGWLGDPLARPGGAAARRPRPAARHLRRAHGPDLRQRAAARRRRPARHRRPRARRRRRAAAGSRSPAPAWSACSPRCSPARTAPPRWWCSTRRRSAATVAEALGLETLDPDADDPAVDAQDPRGGTPPTTAAPTWSSSAAARRRRCTSRCGCCGRRARSSTWPSTRAARTRSGSARSSTTTGWRCAAPRSAGCRAGWRRPGTANGSPPRPSTCCAPYGDAIRKHLISAVVPVRRGARPCSTDLADRRRQELQAVLACLTAVAACRGGYRSRMSTTRTGRPATPRYARPHGTPRTGWVCPRCCRTCGSTAAPWSWSPRCRWSRAGAALVQPLLIRTVLDGISAEPPGRRRGGRAGRPAAGRRRDRRRCATTCCSAPPRAWC